MSDAARTDLLDPEALRTYRARPELYIFGEVATCSQSLMAKWVDDAHRAVEASVGEVLAQDFVQTVVLCVSP